MNSYQSIFFEHSFITTKIRDYFSRSEVNLTFFNNDFDFTNAEGKIFISLVFIENKGVNQDWFVTCNNSFFLKKKKYKYQTR